MKWWSLLRRAWPQIMLSMCGGSYVLLVIALCMQGSEWARMVVFSAPVIVQAVNYAAGAVLLAGMELRTESGYWPWARRASLAEKQDWRERTFSMLKWPVPLAVGASAAGVWCANASRAWVGEVGYVAIQNFVQAVLGGVASFGEVWHAYRPGNEECAAQRDGEEVTAKRMRILKRIVFGMVGLSALMLLSVGMALSLAGIVSWVHPILVLGPILVMVAGYAGSAILGSAVPEKRRTGKWPWSKSQAEAVMDGWTIKVYKMLIVEVITALAGSGLGSAIVALALPSGGEEERLAVLNMVQCAVFTAGFLLTQWINAKRKAT